MKAIVKSLPEKGFQLQEIERPEICFHNDVLIRISAVGICGTDVHIYHWDEWAQSRIKTPLTAGHEFVGYVEAVGDGVQHVKIGDRVSAEGHITCNHCRFCRTGNGHICEDVEIIGVDRAGCFAEYLLMPADNLWPVAEGIPEKVAAVFDPIGNAMHTVMTVPISGKTVLISGCGPIGLFALAIAVHVGAASVVVIEPSAYKRELASRLGADLVLDPSDTGLNEIVHQKTEGLGPELFLEMSGAASALQSGFRMLRNGGDAVVLGIPHGDVAVDWPEIIFKGLTIHAINGRRMYDTWYQSQTFLEKHLDSLLPVITHTFAFDDFQHAFDLIETGKAGKVVLTLHDS